MTNLAAEPDTRPVLRGESVSAKTKVLYVAGQGRSGTTLLGRLLGEVAGFVSVGEVVHLFRPVVQTQLCGCGSPLRECDFWQGVMDEAFGGFDKVDFERILLAKRTLERIRTIPRLFAPVKSASVTRLMQEYLTTINSLYQAIAKMSGGLTIADTSKSALYTYCLSRCPNVDLQIVHLVRDSRAVAYSYRRRKANPAATTGKAYLGEVSPARIAMEWSAQHLLMSMLKPSGDRYVFMRYEDLVSDPRAALSRICTLIGKANPNLDFLNEEEIPVGRHHIVFGNPDRFQQTIRIRIDDEWREKMRTGHRSVVTALTLPLLMRYGYMGRTSNS